MGSPSVPIALAAAAFGEPSSSPETDEMPGDGRSETGEAVTFSDERSAASTAASTATRSLRNGFFRLVNEEKRRIAANRAKTNAAAGFRLLGFFLFVGWRRDDADDDAAPFFRRARRGGIAVSTVEPRGAEDASRPPRADDRVAAVSPLRNGPTTPLPSVPDRRHGVPPLPGGTAAPRGASENIRTKDETEKLSLSINEFDATILDSMKDMMEMALVRSIRAASEAGDFVLLQKLVYASVDYATAIAKDGSSSSSSSIALLSPRIFGEAITSLSKTKASLSKIKGLWNYFVTDLVSLNPSVLASPPSAYELNAMLTSLRDRRKVSAALKLYRETVTTVKEEENSGVGLIKGDAYTASILFGMLTDSIPSPKVNNRLDGPSGIDGSYTSPCWQWNEAMEMLNTFSSEQLNNYGYAALLKVNERATEEYNMDASMRHDGVKCAMSVLERMKKDNISPDVVTCSTLMTTFDKGRNWKAAVKLLNAMRSSSTIADIEQKKWSLPLPNTYTYSLAISVCARCNQGEVALSLLDQMTEESASLAASNDAENVVDGGARPNNWVYNAALLACAESTKSTAKQTKSKGVHLTTALDILEKMEDSDGMNDALPDTVTYNTVLSAIDGRSFDAMKEESTQNKQNNTRLIKHDHIIDLVADILDSMKARGIARDAITYYNAITACNLNAEDSLAILRRAVSDMDFIEMTSNKNEVVEATTSQLKGRAATGIIFVANAALLAVAKSGDIHAVPEILEMLSKANSKLNAESIVHIIRSLGKNDDCEAILALLICLRAQDFANDILVHRYSIDILSNLSSDSLPMIEERIYSAAITSCLRQDELGMADHILVSMKKNGLYLNQRSLKEIIAEYCRMAMTSSKEEFKVARLAKRQQINLSRYGIVEPIYITSRARTKAALAVLKAVDKPLVTPNLLGTVAKACCAAGLWQDARSTLRRMHRAAISELRSQGNGSGGDRTSGRAGMKFLDELPRLHRSLLKFCAKGGNITPALNFADDIQFLASQFRKYGGHQSQRAVTGKSTRTHITEEGENGPEEELITLSSRLLMDIPTPPSIPESDFNNAGAVSNTLDRPLGLTGQDWKLIMIAASRGGHWKVCLGTLPFLRPYVKETHPMYAREYALPGSHPSNRPSLSRLNRKYERIARALTAAILCFEARSQYAWAIRAIEDWIEWSGRRPRKEAVASACRVLARRYRGQEVLGLVTRVMSIAPVDDSSDNGLSSDSDASDYTYEKAIYTESINALHKSGLYEEADQLYAEGVANGHLPWSVMDNQGAASQKQLMLDLHGMSAAVAHSAVRVALQKEIMGASSDINDENAWTKDVMIITGLGRRSGERFRPILRPEVQRMLTEEFFPPLTTSSVPGNLGALLTPSEEIGAWLTNQKQQKGERLLIVADVLRDISSGNRLEKALASSGNRLEMALRKKFESSEKDDRGPVVRNEDKDVNAVEQQ